VTRCHLHAACPADLLHVSRPVQQGLWLASLSVLAKRPVGLHRLPRLLVSFRRTKRSSSSNVYYMHGRDVNGGHCVSPDGLQVYSLPQQWLCRAPKVRRGGEGCVYVSM
jgi:hypothetical protein